MSFKVQATMERGLRGDETKPRRFDLTMSRRTRRPPAATLATSCHEQDHHQAMLCLSDHLQPRQPELDAHQEHQTSDQRSEEDSTEEQVSPPLTCLLQKKDDESEAQQQQQQQECQDNSRRFSLLELIEDEAVDDDDDVKVKGAATAGTEENAAGAAREVAEGAAAAAAGEPPKRSDQVAGRSVIGIMRRYVKVRLIKPRRASPEKNATPVC